MINFSARLERWSGPAAFFFVVLPEELDAEIRLVTGSAPSTWGILPVAATVEGRACRTSLFPTSSGSLLPIDQAIATELGLRIGDVLTICLEVEFPGPIITELPAPKPTMTCGILRQPRTRG
nr:DUF1905 domain-containing protein [Sphingomonas corticis]